MDKNRGKKLKNVSEVSKKLTYECNNIKAQLQAKFILNKFERESMRRKYF